MSLETRSEMATLQPTSVDIAVKKRPVFTVCFLLAVTIVAAWIISLIISKVVQLAIDEESEASWIYRFFFTLIGYASVFVPGYILINFVRNHNLHYLGGFVGKGLRLILTGNTTESDIETHSYREVDKQGTVKLERTLYEKAYQLVFCCVGLQVSYLTWGVLQEKIMTRDYTDDAGNIEKFKDSQFLVFVNRILAFIFSGVYLFLTHHSVHQTPLYKYSFCSVSNTLSSWCQYEALKFVNFPTQVLAKSGKVIPVMVMGKLVSGTKYKYYEYATAVLISVGMAAFFFGSEEEREDSSVTTFSGVVLLCGYLIFDSFTANWQSALFKEHKPTSVQMMCGVNFMSCLFTSASLIQQGGFFYSLSFASRYPRFIWDCLLTAITSASGQLFIFSTIANFGPVVFTIIMTVRQGLSILLSCLLYNHVITMVGILGVFTVFLAIFLRIYYGQVDRRKQQHKLVNPSVSKV